MISEQTFYRPEHISQLTHRPEVRDNHPSVAELHIQIADLDLGSKIEKIHEWMEPKIRASGILNYVQTDDARDLSSDARRKFDALHKANQRLTDALLTPEAQYALAHRKRLHAQADQKTHGQSYEAQIGARVEAFDGKILLVSDLDNTLTDQSKQVKPHGADPLLLGSAILDPLIGPNREHFTALVAAGWGQLVRDFPAIFEEGGNHAPLREGVHTLAQYTKDHDIPVTIVTTNFFPFARRAIERIHNATHFNVFAVQDGDARAAQKGTVLQWLAVQYPNHALIYNGDGTSDIPTLEAKDVVAGYGALKDNSFALSLDVKNLPFFTYETGYDTVAALHRIRPHTKAA